LNPNDEEKENGWNEENEILHYHWDEGFHSFLFVGQKRNQPLREDISSK
jgi:hypothetical protein